MAKKEKKPKKMFGVGRIIVLSILMLFFVAGFVLHWFVNSDTPINVGATQGVLKDAISPEGAVEGFLGEAFKNPKFKLLFWKEELIWSKNIAGEYNEPDKQNVITWNWICGGYQKIEGRERDEAGIYLGGEVVSHSSLSLFNIISIVMAVMMVGFSFWWFGWPFIQKKRGKPPGEEPAAE
ncbi:MAG: hypothetical protein FWD58_07795 [Firmicutes bacterium]|nr:hypothetical protein [Bacillota bacterium]